MLALILRGHFSWVLDTKAPATPTHHFKSVSPLSKLGLLALIVASFIPFAQQTTAQATQPNPMAAPLPATVAVAASPTLAQTPAEFPADGTYLLGQSENPDQLGAAYMVFEANNGHLTGAIYMPSSSFDCFQAEVQGNELAMTIMNSYTEEQYPYAIALASDSAIADINGAATPFELEGFYQLNGPSDNDLRMLETCKAVYAD